MFSNFYSRILVLNWERIDIEFRLYFGTCISKCDVLEENPGMKRGKTRGASIPQADMIFLANEFCRQATRSGNLVRFEKISRADGMINEFPCPIYGNFIKVAMRNMCGTGQNWKY